MRATQEFSVFPFSLNKMTSAPRTFAVGNCLFFLFSDCFYISNMVLFATFGCDVGRRYCVCNQLNILLGHNGDFVGLDSGT